jgi:hypothetical protein
VASLVSLVEEPITRTRLRLPPGGRKGSGHQSRGHGL